MSQSDESPRESALEKVSEGELRIAADGTWFHEGEPIRRKELVKLFSTVLKRDENGDFWLQTPVEKFPIAVEDAPFIALELRESGSGESPALDLRTNVDAWVEAGPEHPLRVETDPDSGEPRPYLLVQDGPGGGLEALLARSVFYQLVEQAVPGEGEFEGKLGVWSRGAFFPLGPLPEGTGG